MADRSSPEAQRAAFADLATALGEYLEAHGWRAIVVGDARVQPQHDAPSEHYEFIVRFTGGRIRRAAGTEAAPRE